MKKTLRFLSLLLALTLLLPGFVTTARADIITLGIYFTGTMTRGDGSTEVRRLEGRFRILQNGEEVGTIAAGQQTIALRGGERIRIEPLPESIEPGWDLSTALVSVDLKAQGNVTVPIHVERLSPVVETPEPTPELTPEPTPEPETPAPTEAPTPEPAPVDTPVPATPAPVDTQAPDWMTGTEGGAGTPAPTGGTDEMPWDHSQTDDTEESPVVAAGPIVTPTPLPTLAPTQIPSPVPEPEPLSPGEGKGRVKVSVFENKHADGNRGPYEKPVPGQEIWLVTAEDETAVAVKAANSDGIVLFDGVEPGDYRIRAFIDDDWGFAWKSDNIGADYNCLESVTGEATSDIFTVTAGGTTERGVGILPTIHVSGYCWMDDESDGIRTEGEAMLPGIRITLEGQKNGLFFETTSDNDGNWRISHVRPGYYTMNVYVPDGMMFTRYSKAGGKDRSIFTTEGVSVGTKRIDTNDNYSKDDQNIGFVWAGQIRGTCFLDANYNGMLDEGEEPLAGVKVCAIKQNKGEEVAVAFSDEEGHFTLNSLRGNTYTIRALLPEDGSDFTRVVSDPMGNHFQSRPGRRENFWTDFVLGDMENREMTVGAIYPGSLSGTAYYDDDLSSTMNGNEKIVQGFHVELLDEDGNVVAMDNANYRGLYEFTGLVPGTYSLRFTAPTGYAFTKLGEGNVALNLTHGEGYTEPFRIEIGEQKTGMDLGMIIPGTVTGSVFADLNDNGLKDEGEPGMQGTVVKLIDESNEEAYRAVIGENPTFLFDAVMPGRYRLEYELPEGAIFANAVVGGNEISGEDGRGQSEWFDFGTGGYVNAPLCGALTLGRLEGTAYEDHNGNGIRDEGEAAFIDMKVRLVPSRSNLEQIVAVTGVDGQFVLPDLHPDSYTLYVELPEGYVLSRTDYQNLPLMAGENNQSVQLPVAMGQTWTGQMLGAVMPAGLEGRVWLDVNNNGLFDEGETTPAGRTVTVTDESTGNVFTILTTDSEGRFATKGMIPGSFTVSLPLDSRIIAAKEGDSTFREENGRLVMTGITLAENENKTGLLAGMVQYTLITGTVWIDLGGTVSPLANAAMTLTDADGNILQAMTTGESGEYRFDNLMPGTYRIEGSMPEGSVVVEPGDERMNEGRVSIATRTEGRKGWSDVFEVRMGEDLGGMDMGCVLPGRLGDLCWLDRDGDGLQNWSEEGIPHVRIELLRNGELVMETESDQYGFYRFSDIYPAVYTLRVYAPAEVKPTVHRTDIPLISSVLEESEDEIVYSVELKVESDKANYNADLGFVCRTPGVEPEGIGQGKKQDWTKIDGSDY